MVDPTIIAELILSILVFAECVEFGGYFFVVFGMDEMGEVDSFCVEVVHQNCLDFCFLGEFNIVDGYVMVFGFFFDLLFGF